MGGREIRWLRLLLARTVVCDVTGSISLVSGTVNKHVALEHTMAVVVFSFFTTIESSASFHVLVGLALLRKSSARALFTNGSATTSPDTSPDSADDTFTTIYTTIYIGLFLRTEQTPIIRPDVATPGILERNTLNPEAYNILRTNE